MDNYFTSGLKKSKEDGTLTEILFSLRQNKRIVCLYNDLYGVKVCPSSVGASRLSQPQLPLRGGPVDRTEPRHDGSLRPGPPVPGPEVARQPRYARLLGPGQQALHGWVRQCCL